MNPELSKNFKDVFFGLLTSQFNLEIRSARFKNFLLWSLGEFAFLAISALLFRYDLLAYVFAFGFIFIGLTYIYHIRTNVKRVDLKTTFFIAMFSLVLIPLVYCFSGKEVIGPAFLQTQIYFLAFFVLKLLPALVLVLSSTIIWAAMFENYDWVQANIFAANPSYEANIFFTISLFMMSVIMIGSLIAMTIGAYDREQLKAKQLFEDYNKQLYKRGSGNAYNDRYLLTNVGTLGVLTEKGDIPGFTAVSFSIDNMEDIKHLSEEARKETFDVFARKVNSVLSEDEIFVRQEENTFVLLLNTANEHEVYDKVDELLAVIHMTIFAHMPKTRLTLSAGYAVHKKGHSTASTMQRAADNMLVARRKGGNTRVGGHDQW